MSILPFHQRISVGPQRQEIMFRDGTVVTLHPVHDCGVADKFHRAMLLPGAITMVIDLRRLVPQIEPDICTAQERDWQGIVFYSLRGAFKTREPFVQAACEHGRALAQQLEAA
jgi:hypothetical protein